MPPVLREPAVLSRSSLRHCRAGRHLVAFLERGQLLLVAVSAMGEPPAALRRQLVLVHGQARTLTKNFGR